MRLDLTLLITPSVKWGSRCGGKGPGGGTGTATLLRGLVSLLAGVRGGGWVAPHQLSHGAPREDSQKFSLVPATGMVGSGSLEAICWVTAP